MNLLNAGESKLLNSSDPTEVVNIIAEETDGKIKFSIHGKQSEANLFFVLPFLLLCGFPAPSHELF